MSSFLSSLLAFQTPGEFESEFSGYSCSRIFGLTFCRYLSAHSGCEQTVIGKRAWLKIIALKTCLGGKICSEGSAVYLWV